MVCFSVILRQQIPQIYPSLDYFISLKQFHANFMESLFSLGPQNSLSLEVHHLIAFTCPILIATHLEG